MHSSLVKVNWYYGGIYRINEGVHDLRRNYEINIQIPTIKYFLELKNNGIFV
jgi:hypothetical protein